MNLELLTSELQERKLNTAEATAATDILR